MASNVSSASSSAAFGDVAATDSAAIFWRSVCYHEPRVHDHKLYFQLTRIHIYVLVPFGVLSILLNILALLCLCTPPRITSGVIVYLKLLLALNVVYTLSLLAEAIMPMFCDTQYSAREHKFFAACQFERRFLRHSLPRFVALIHCAHVWTLSSMAAHRYWKVSRPVVSRFKDTVERAFLLLGLLVLGVFVFRLPTFTMELQLKTTPIARIVRRPEHTEFLSPYRLVYHSLLDPVLGRLLPFALMSAFSFLTLMKMARNRRRPFFISKYAHKKGSMNSVGTTSTTTRTGTTTLSSGRSNRTASTTTTNVVEHGGGGGCCSSASSSAASSTRYSCISNRTLISVHGGGGGSGGGGGGGNPQQKPLQHHQPHHTSIGDEQQQPPSATQQQTTTTTTTPECGGASAAAAAAVSSSAKNSSALAITTIDRRGVAAFRTYSNRWVGQRAVWSERRTTLSVVVLVALYLALHLLELVQLVRKWMMLATRECPTRADYYRSATVGVLAMASCSVNAVVFIAFNTRIRKLFKTHHPCLWLRGVDTSRRSSSSSSGAAIVYVGPKIAALKPLIVPSSAHEKAYRKQGVTKLSRQKPVCGERTKNEDDERWGRRGGGGGGGKRHHDAISQHQTASEQTILACAAELDECPEVEFAEEEAEKRQN